MDYKIRNAQQTISPELRAKAKELAQNKVTDGARKTTNNEVLQLVQVANKDGIVSEEELKFIAAQASNSNLSHLEKANFQPVNNEFQFEGVQQSYLNNLRAKVIPRQTSASVVDKNVRSNPDLQPFLDGINNQKLSVRERQSLVAQYADAHKSYASAFPAFTNDFLNTGNLMAMAMGTDQAEELAKKAQASNQKVSEHDLRMVKPGLYRNLFNASSREPVLQILDNLTASINKGYSRTPEQLFRSAVTLAKGFGSQNPQKDALTAIAALMNSVHIGQGSGANEQHNRVLGQMRAAYIALNQGNSPDSVIMNHGVGGMVPKAQQNTQDFTSDNNLHFWSHAYLAYNVMSSTTGSETQARDLSAYMGASYELSHFDERQGNSALKDIVMNAYGSEFGIQLLKNPTTPLPTRFEGPQVENRRDFPE
ncbi:hypothetical protein COW36_10090 [bacterium (Candidatus Blackallbacteria) CG17_big_fil_post_rev_8_21_14_2_50_48_46]|uniref:Uncharacterized protein n=1 Tax=bacterium (Candidatus Blackallbacteria) CG17_big_fil_post_rev_8_21_14_2_50_48_46 TaxID=2014261 RepID=A0A2M7G593_9BACT|nr:MAG: hypothetical protein COW64_07160 [bacterium (Candidatus Blackallbacteria) CG18_big_fil_WC_8_21_14_2_50_49_26]PIW17112.1 MAG: hypothetical protein COW36_10090 [bacterium (Candidatus Blackallbacteria) CG17_big_fil_post_rev_8_21_14_2_50_48_46]PIW49184.1 MAG: hypothetical protein COW20_06705 [bacterium (Candidatus Blackallbacteria) CG13_big_fil_rev_8_21_14_2_50_49_14]